MNKIIRTIHPEIKVLDATRGLVEYIASDESIDCSREVISAAGWRFTLFAKNAPFVDSHDYRTIGNTLGKVVDFKVVKDQLVETVQWAIDVGENLMAHWGFKMTQAGYLKAVSVGFIATKFVTRYDQTGTWEESIKDLGLGDLEDSVNCIYLEQEQLELSACCIGANGNAVAKSYKAGLLTDADLEQISIMQAKSETAPASADPADDAGARLRARKNFLMDYQMKLAKSL